MELLRFDKLNTIQYLTIIQIIDHRFTIEYIFTGQRTTTDPSPTLHHCDRDVIRGVRGAHVPPPDFEK